jgi:hypothetical protein
MADVRRVVQQAWTAYTPTWTLFTIGNATQAFYYYQVGKAVFVKGSVTFGSTTAVGTPASPGPTFTLPVTSVTYPNTAVGWGQASLRDEGTNTFQGELWWRSTTTAAVRASSVSGTLLANSILSNTAPFTWATGDSIHVSFFYEAA